MTHDYSEGLDVSKYDAKSPSYLRYSFLIDTYIFPASRNIVKHSNPFGDAKRENIVKMD